MPPKLKIERILKIIKLKQEHPSWGWKKLSKETGISKNTIKRYILMFENSTTEMILLEDVIPSQHCKECKIIVRNSFYKECPNCKKEMKRGVK